MSARSLYTLLLTVVTPRRIFIFALLCGVSFIIVSGYTVMSREVNIKTTREAYGSMMSTLMYYAIIGEVDLYKADLSSDEFVFCPVNSDWNPSIESVGGCKFLLGLYSEECGFWTYAISCMGMYLPREYWNNPVLRSRVTFVLENACAIVWDERFGREMLPGFRFDVLPLSVELFRRHLGCSSASDTPDYEFVLSIGEIGWQEARRIGWSNSLTDVLADSVTEVYRIQPGSNQLVR